MILLGNLFIIVAFRAGQRNLGGVDLGLSVERRTNVMFPVAVGTDRNFAHAFREGLSMNAFIVISQNPAVAVTAGLWQMPS